MVQSERNYHSKTRGGRKKHIKLTITNIGTYIKKTHRKPSEQLFSKSATQ